MPDSTLHPKRTLKIPTGASEFVAPVLALLTVEEQVWDWAPDLDFQVVGQAIIIGSIALIPGPGR